MASDTDGGAVEQVTKQERERAYYRAYYARRRQDPAWVARERERKRRRMALKRVTSTFDDRERDREAARARMKPCTPERNRRNKESLLRRVSEDPVERMKFNARAAAWSARRHGRLVPEPCAICGASEVDADHYLGYEPEHALTVQWLCRRCHHLVEIARRERGRVGLTRDVSAELDLARVIMAGRAARDSIRACP